MGEPLFTEFRLRSREGDVLWPFLTDDGAFHGIGTPLFRKIGTARGGQWEVRPQWEIERLFAAGYDKPLVDASGWTRNLSAVANALNKGDRSLASIALVLSRIPALPSERHARAMANADRSIKYTPTEPRIPARHSGAGEWTTDGVAGSEAFESYLIDAGYKPDVLQAWRTFRNSILEHGHSLELAREVFEQFIENVPPGEIETDVKAILQPSKPMDELWPPGPSRSFDSVAMLNRYLGSAPPGYEWHHIVEQSVISEHPEDPTITRTIQNTHNVVLIPKLTHLMITAEMNTGRNTRRGVRQTIWRRSQAA